MTNELPQREAPRTIGDWCDYINAWAASKGWNDGSRSFGDMCSLFHTEISEAYEEYRKHHTVRTVYFSTDSEGIAKPEGIGIELADLLIRVFHFAAQEELDLQTLLIQKMNYNAQRSYRHGGKKT